MDVGVGGVTDVGGGLGLGIVVHGDGAGFSFHIDGAAGRKDVGLRLLFETSLAMRVMWPVVVLDIGVSAQDEVAGEGMDEEVAAVCRC